MTGHITMIDILPAAERALSSALGVDVRLGDAVRLTDDARRNIVVRCRDLSGDRSASYIIKKVVAENYSHADAASHDVRRFFNDWVGCQFVSEAAGDSPHCARFLAGDSENGFFVIEDLGEHRSLVEPLLEGDATSAEDVLMNFSARLAGLHAATIGRSEQFEAIFDDLNPGVWAQVQEEARLNDPFGQLPASLARLGVEISTGADRELREIRDDMEAPGPFFSYVHGDPCPDNVFVSADGLRLIDFEFGRFRHALMDGAYPRMIFPSCWCANRLPGHTVEKVEGVYRSELAKSCHEAQDDRLFESALASACGFWLFSTMSRQLPRVIDADQTWGIATVRQRLLARLEAFLAMDDGFDRLPDLRRLADRVHQMLVKVWPVTDPLPLYPAFRELSATREDR